MTHPRPPHTTAPALSLAAALMLSACSTPTTEEATGPAQNGRPPARETAAAVP